MGDLDAAVAWAKKDGNGDTSKLGITGFCWGGRIVWLYAVHSKDIKAGVAWYGRLSGTGKATELQPRYPIDLAKDVKAPVLGLYGEEDAGIPVKDVEAMREALKKAGKTASEIVVYPKAPHAFFADYRPSYRKEPAEDGWKRMLAWFKKHGVA
jgi:carboxymethylenebutenolidase